MVILLMYKNSHGFISVIVFNMFDSSNISLNHFWFYHHYHPDYLGEDMVQDGE